MAFDVRHLAGARLSRAVIQGLLLTTALTVPALAEIETVVVTAERKAEDLQTVPIAVTALTSADLKAKQVQNFRDLQFHVPSVIYTKSNFGGAQFQIRGITTQFGLGSAVAQNIDDIFLEAPSLVSSEYYDIDRIEVARGPQSTSYGRAATGGAVNVITSKPDLNNFSARTTLDYGEFNTLTPDAMVNIPIIEGELGIRLAAHADFHDGYEKNVYSGPAIFPQTTLHSSGNGLGILQGRASIRWEPSSDTTIDIIGDVSRENDTRSRADKQLCHRDPSGVVGCLPDQLAFQPINGLATLGNVLGSKQGLTDLLSQTFGVPFATALTQGNALGLFNLAGNTAPTNPAGPAAINGPGSGAAGDVPNNLLTVDSPFTPHYKTFNDVIAVNWSQKIFDWLSALVDGGYAAGNQLTEQSFQPVPPENISAQITSSVNAFNTTAPFSTVASLYDPIYFNIPGSLPISNTRYGGTYGSYAGIIDYTHGGILTKTPYNASYDEDYFHSKEWTGELRLSTSFAGRLNFTAGLFYMSYTQGNQYWVAAPALDWDALVLGARQSTLATGAQIEALSAFDGENRNNNTLSRSAFLEGTYELIPNELQLIAGARFNDDRQHSTGSAPNKSCAVPTYVPGTAAASPGGLLNYGVFPIGAPITRCFTIATPFVQTGKPVTGSDKWTGRINLQWTPKLSFTDQTQVYLTLSRGALSGGVNVSNSNAGSVGEAPTSFLPATVDAVELGTKNTLLDDTLTANLTAWYYNYENYQVGIIANRAAQTINIPAHLYGLEGEFVWQPSDDLALNLTLSLTRSMAGTAYISDQRNPTNNSPNSILVKDMTNGSLCVIVPTSAAATGHTPGENGAFHVNNFWLPQGGDASIDAPYGIPLVNYGVCPSTAAGPTATRAALAAAGFSYSVGINPQTGLPIMGTPSTGFFDAGGQLRDGTGIPVNIHGDRLPGVPDGQIGVGGQYTIHLDDGFTLVPRVDYYWQSGLNTRVWNDAIDRISGWDVMNAQIQLNAADNNWYVRVFAKNVFDKRNPTGYYLSDATSGLFTNVFTEDPRVIGLSLGASW